MESILAGGLHVLLLLLFISGCTTPEQRVKHLDLPNTSSVSGTRQAAVNRSDTIEIREMQFHPSVLTVDAGTTVVYVNKDLVAHDITEQTTKAWSSNLLSPTKSWSMIANETVDYLCSIHVVMKGRIVVK